MKADWFVQHQPPSLSFLGPPMLSYLDVNLLPSAELQVAIRVTV